MNASRAVARTMIEMAAQRGMRVTNLTLQKLLYFSHGLMLARHDEPLIDDTFQAWKYGPVVERLYHDLKMFGPSHITPDDGFIGLWPQLAEDSERERNVIGAVLDQLGKMSGGQLIDISHDAKGPWHAVYESKKNCIEIPNDEIKKYFKTIVR